MNTSQDSINEHFDNYREDIEGIGYSKNPKSLKSSDKDITEQYQKHRNKRRHKDWNTRLRILNKALRNKLKDLNGILEKELDRVYIK